MSRELREKLELLVKLKKSLPDCERKRELDKEIQSMKAEIHSNQTHEPIILVKHAGKPIGVLDYDSKESSWVFRSNNGSKTEVGFQYEDARGWASMNGFQLKVEAI